MSKDAWTPYALEPIRRSLLWRRRILAGVLALLVLVLLAVAVALQPEKVTETQISLAGGGNSQIDIQIQEAGRSAGIRVDLQPGGVVHAGGDPVGPRPDRLSSANLGYPAIRDARPINLMAYVLGWGPLLLLAYFVWAAGRGEENPVAEVNFGIYKGAMPLEMMTESYRHLVRTQHIVDEPIFGKERSDYVPDDGRRAFELAPTGRR